MVRHSARFKSRYWDLSLLIMPCGA